MIDGFGGAFNELGWDALLALTDADRDAVMKALFDPSTGLRFNWGRTPIGASDYAESRYTLDEAPGDYAMKSFSIERDRKALLPYLKAALKYQPKLRVWASAWTPPTWLKTNGAFDSGAMKDDATSYDAYALYLAKFVEAYRAEGIPVEMIVPQNEPGQLTNYPSCDWKPAQYLEFVRDHLGPLFAQRKPGAGVFVGTINSGTFELKPILSDATAMSYVAGFCMQWDGVNQVALLAVAAPAKPVMQSETDCGNHYWEPGYDPNHAQNDFTYAAYTWRKFQQFISLGSSSYMLWNLVLDENGKNIDSKQPWPQNSAVIVNRNTKQVTYTPMFWATKHFSGLIDVGAHLVQSSGSYADQIAFLNPDGTVLVELLNATGDSTNVHLVVAGKSFSATLPANSFATAVIPPS